MTQLSYHFAFRAGDELHDIADGFISRMEVDGARAEPQTVNKMMKLMVGEVLLAYITTPSQLVKVEPKIQRLIKLATGTANKTAGMMVGTVTRKMSVEQCIEAARYMDGSRLLFEEGATSCVAFPIPDDMAHAASPMLETIQAQESEAEIRRLKEWLMELSDVGADHFIGRPADMLDLGPVSRKVVTKGKGVMVNAIQALIRDVIPQLTVPQAAVLAGYLDHLVLEYD